MVFTGNQQPGFLGGAGFCPSTVLGETPSLQPTCSIFRGHSTQQVIKLQERISQPCGHVHGGPDAEARLLRASRAEAHDVFPAEAIWTWVG